jgi:hypothetical protein
MRHLNNGASAGATVRRGVAALVGMALAASAGCSFLFVEGPPKHASHDSALACTDSYTWPVVDTLVAVSQGLRILTIVTPLGKSFERPLSVDPKTDFMVGLGTLTLAATSATVGYVRVKECQDLGRARPSGDPERSKTVLGRRQPPLPLAPVAPSEADSPPANAAQPLPEEAPLPDVRQQGREE